MFLSQPLGRPFVFRFGKLRKASEPDLPANQPRYSWPNCSCVFFCFFLFFLRGQKRVSREIDLSTKNLCSMEVRRRRSFEAKPEAA